MSALEAQTRKLTDRNNILQHKLDADDIRRLRTSNAHKREQRQLLQQLTRAQADAQKHSAQVRPRSSATSLPFIHHSWRPACHCQRPEPATGTLRIHM